MSIEIKELAKLICKENPRAALSGSLSLSLQDINIERPVKDLDFYLPIGFPFKMIEGMVSDPDFTSDDYDSPEWERDQYKYGEIKIDVFTPRDVYIEPETSYRDGLLCVRFKEILKFKMDHATSDHSSRIKHSKDILFILTNNKRFQEW